MHKVWFSLVAVLTFSLAAHAWAEPRGSKKDPVEQANVELFDAIKSGDIEVKVIAKDSSKGNVLIQNKTQKRLRIQLPEALAAAPVMAQVGFGNGINAGNGLNAGRQGGAANQTLGVGFQGGVNGNNFLNGGNNRGPGNNVGANPFAFPGGGIFDVEPEQVRKIKMTAVCLEHGKRNPNSKIKYQLIPLESYTSNSQTLELVKMLDRGEIDQSSAQAAAWHLENGLTWEALAQKSYFSGENIALAKKVVAEAEKRATAKKSQSPSLAGSKQSGSRSGQ